MGEVKISLGHKERIGLVLLTRCSLSATPQYFVPRLTSSLPRAPTWPDEHCSKPFGRSSHLEWQLPGHLPTRGSIEYMIENELLDRRRRHRPVRHEAMFA